MIRKNLLATTAFVVATSLSSFDAHAQVPAAASPRDKNDEFLCNYGGFEVGIWGEGSASWSMRSGWQHVAVPIVGRGQTVSTIKVRNGRNSPNGYARFTIGIYSNTPSGFPGKPISTGYGKARVHCGPDTISIQPTKLERNTTYWVEETIPTLRKWGHGQEIYWAEDPEAKSPAYSQYAKYSFSSYISPWTEQTGGPYVRLK